LPIEALLMLILSLKQALKCQMSTVKKSLFRYAILLTKLNVFKLLFVILILLAKILNALNLFVWNVQTLISTGCKPSTNASQSFSASFKFCFHLFLGDKALITWETL
jgi:cytoskeletal protein RodZ